MKVTISLAGVYVRREPDDRKLRTGLEFWYALKVALNGGSKYGDWLRPKGGAVPGLNSIPHSLRHRKNGRYIYDESYQVRLSHESYAERGEIYLDITPPEQKGSHD